MTTVPSSPSNKIKYINNKELLGEIHRSKKTFCYYVEPQYADHDTIVRSVSEITPELIQAVREKKAKPRGKPAIAIDTILPESIVVRVMTYEHIPLDPDRVRKSRVTDQSYARTTFPPFKHYILLDTGPKEVLRSHWKDGFDNGSFDPDSGRINDRLARMFMMLVERYSRRGNWRGYCVDEQTQALTQRGWLNYEQINEQDIILSYDGKKLAWSKIKSIFRDNFNGNMFQLSGIGIDALVTPGHKFLTTNNELVPVELLRETDRLRLMGSSVEAPIEQTYSDSFVELIGWVATEGSFYKRNNANRLKIYQNEGRYSDRIRKCLNTLGEKFSEYKRSRNGNLENVAFTINKDLINTIVSEIGTNRIIPPEFILKLTTSQRELLLQTMIDGDGWRTRQGKYLHIGYCQKDKEHLDSFLMLATLCGHQVSFRKREITTTVNNLSSHIYEAHFLSKRRNIKRVENINMHGAKQNGATKGLGKVTHPNKPTVPYTGMVWCPETEYGCFVARRGDYIHISGNTYVDEMRSQALVQLSQIGLQFDESKSDNPFAFYTTAIRNCLGGDTLVLTKEFGSVPIEEISEKDVTLLDGNGDWVKCHIFDHGVQETQLTYFQGQGGKKIEIWSTLNHGWISENTRVETKDFNGHNTKINDLRPSKVVKNAESYQKGLTHGVIYGDGSANKNCKDFYYIRICSNISDFMPIFEKYPVFYAPSYNGDPTFSISQAWANLKKFPENPGEDTDYLLGFLRGWFAADGCVSKVPTPTLCGDEAEYNWLKTWGPIVGWHINNFTTLAKVTNFGERKKQSLNIHLKKASMHSEDFILSKHRERWDTRKETKKQWFVYGSRQGDIENKYQRVYCPVVETTQSFALSSGIHSSNCFTRVLNLEKKSQNIRDDLLIIAGAQPSYTRQIDNELDHRFADYAAQAAAKEAKKTE